MTQWSKKTQPSELLVAHTQGKEVSFQALQAKRALTGLLLRPSTRGHCWTMGQQAAGLQLTNIFLGFGV